MSTSRKKLESIYHKLPSSHGQRLFHGALFPLTSKLWTWMSVNFSRIPTTMSPNPKARQGVSGDTRVRLAALATAGVKSGLSEAETIGNDRAAPGTWRNKPEPALPPRIWEIHRHIVFKITNERRKPCTGTSTGVRKTQTTVNEFLEAGCGHLRVTNSREAKSMWRCTPHTFASFTSKLYQVPMVNIGEKNLLALPEEGKITHLKIQQCFVILSKACLIFIRA